MEGRYLIKNRLGDVITLIQVVALHPEYSYRTSEKLEESLGKPNSKATWMEIAKDHGEFFRISRNGMIILLTRFSKDPDGKNPSPLTFEETKILIENAIDLYGKELTRQSNDLQRRSISTVFIAAILTVLASVSSAWFTISSQNKGDEEIKAALAKLELTIKETKLRSTHDRNGDQDTLKAVKK